MTSTAGVAEPRQSLSAYLRRVERGERLLATDPNRPVAELGSPPAVGSQLGRHALAAALDERRGERRRWRSCTRMPRRS